MIYQRTIKQPIEAIGVGLHSGCRVSLTLRPGKPDQGIIFVRTDLPGKPALKCHPFLVNDTRLSSTLVDENHVRVGTIEHLMSAFACFGVDNITVELSAQETPIMDGSSNSFLYLLEQAQIIEQTQAKKKYICIKEEVAVLDEAANKWVKFMPHAGYKVKIITDFGGHPVFKQEYGTFEVDFAKHSYIDEISRARTFGFMYEVEYMRKNGLGLGGNLNNAIVIDETSVLNEGGLRFPDEFVRHKILDAIGDLYIMGYQFIGAFEGYRSGHAINNQLLRKMLNNPNCWEFVTFDDPNDVPNSFHWVK
jgi:UDP-3-O-[3-hydroxymyristoyl] N-acetylglucosamine deacetylase